jgi:hypothetical protein
METTALISEIDKEIARLTEARNLLADHRGGGPSKPARKRPTMSAAARKRIGDAQRKRWAAQKKAEATNSR